MGVKTWFSKGNSTSAYSTLAQTFTTAGATALVFPALGNGEVREISITAGANPVRFTLDGTAPTSTLGIYIAANGTEVVHSIEDVKRFKGISITGDSVATITFFK